MKFIIHIDTGTATTQNSKLLNTDEERIKDLIREKVIENVFMSVNKQKLWLTLNTSDEFEAREIIKTLPYCSQFKHSLDEIM